MVAGALSNIIECTYVASCNHKACCLQLCVLQVVVKAPVLAPRVPAGPEGVPVELATAAAGAALAG